MMLSSHCDLLLFLLISSFLQAKNVLSLESLTNNNNNNNNVIRTVRVVGGTHGNEYTGIWCIKAMEKSQEKIQKTFPSLQIHTLLANPSAYLQNKRFVDTDLNREFIQDKLNNDELVGTALESRRAKYINTLLGPKNDNVHATNTDLIIDLHTTTSNMGCTVIVQPDDLFMCQAAAYCQATCLEKYNLDVIIIMLPVNTLRAMRPQLPSIAKHECTIEVGPVPQGVLRHDIVKQTQQAMDQLLEYMELRNTNQSEKIQQVLQSKFPNGHVTCFQSATSTSIQALSSKIAWPSIDDNPNFPAYMVHESVQDQDFKKLLKKGDPLFVDLEDNIIPYNGSHGDEIYLMFINEGGYYYSSSGTGIGVAVKQEYNLKDGSFI